MHQVYIDNERGISIPNAENFILLLDILNTPNEYQSNSLWIKLVLDDYKEVYEPESFDNGVIVDACEYAVNIFDKFDELFNEWQE